MENSSDNPQSNAPTTPQVSNINYSPLPPQSTPSVSPSVKKGMGKNVIVILAFILIAVVIGGILYFYFLKTPATYNATVYTPSKTAKAVPSPTPTTEEINKNDNSNKALDSDSGIIDKDINSASSDLNSVNESFNDQQTNLQ